MQPCFFVLLHIFLRTCITFKLIPSFMTHRTVPCAAPPKFTSSTMISPRLPHVLLLATQHKHASKVGPPLTEENEFTGVSKTQRTDPVGPYEMKEGEFMSMSIILWT